MLLSTNLSTFSQERDNPLLRILTQDFIESEKFSYKRRFHIKTFFFFFWQKKGKKVKNII